MRIKTITLYNYRLYLGTNTISFNEVEGKNIFLISGQNGFGKTTFLHSLLWCLYGRLMTDVDESVRKDIANKEVEKNLYSIDKAHESLDELKANIMQTSADFVSKIDTLVASLDSAREEISEKNAENRELVKQFDNIYTEAK